VKRLVAERAAFAGVNEITGVDTGGPGQFGIVCFKLTKGQGEHVTFVNKAAAKVITDYKDNRKRPKKVSPEQQALRKLAERDMQIASLFAELKLKDELLSLHEGSSAEDIQLNLLTGGIATLKVLEQEEKKSGVMTPPTEIAAALVRSESELSSGGTPTFPDLFEDSGSNGSTKYSTSATASGMREWEDGYSEYDAEEQYAAHLDEQVAELDEHVAELQGTKAELQGTKADLEARVRELEYALQNQ